MKNALVYVVSNNFTRDAVYSCCIREPERDGIQGPAGRGVW